MMVLILTDEHESSTNALYRMFEPRVLSSAHVRQIKCNAVNDTVRVYAPWQWLFLCSRFDACIGGLDGEVFRLSSPLCSAFCQRVVSIAAIGRPAPSNVLWPSVTVICARRFPRCSASSRPPHQLWTRRGLRRPCHGAQRRGRMALQTLASQWVL
jgi:hypothetical protein